MGLGFPERFALGAAIMHPLLFISSLAYSLDGSLSPTVSRPADTASGMMLFFFNTAVNGPGQKRFQSFLAISDKSHAAMSA